VQEALVKKKEVKRQTPDANRYPNGAYISLRRKSHRERKKERNLWPHPTTLILSEPNRNW